MAKFIIKRLLKGLLCVWFIWSLIFFLVRVTGDPTDWMLPDGATDKELANLRASLHLDEPLGQQYIDTLTDLLQGDAGNSYYYKRDVAELYSERLGTTLRLALPAFGLAIVMGILVGTVAAIKHNTAIDRIAMTGAVIGYTMPSFCFGIIMLLIFSQKLKLLPSFGTDDWKSLIMPMITLAVSPMGMRRLHQDPPTRWVGDSG